MQTPEGWPDGIRAVILLIGRSLSATSPSTFHFQRNAELRAERKIQICHCNVFTPPSRPANKIAHPSRDHQTSIERLSVRMPSSKSAPPI